MNARIKWIVLALLLWAIAAYLIVPMVWKMYFRHHHSKFSGAPRVTQTSDSHPGDPVNLVIEGEEASLIKALTAAGWYPAERITFDSSARIVLDTVFRKPDDQAPVSALFLFGRKQDLAFELPVGDSPKQRHHVRFWRWDKLKDGRPVWFGAATFDERVGLSHTTGQVTHHIGPDVDAERALLMSGLQKVGWVKEEYFVDGFQVSPEGRNGGGDPWRTDGRLGAIVLIDRK